MAKRPGIHVNISDDLRKRFKAACSRLDTSMTDVVVGLVNTWLEQYEQIASEEKLPETIALYVQRHFYQLRAENIPNIDAIANGEKPTKPDLCRIASVMYPEQEGRGFDELMTLTQRSFPNEKQDQ